MTILTLSSTAQTVEDEAFNKMSSADNLLPINAPTTPEEENVILPGNKTQIKNTPPGKSLKEGSDTTINFTTAIQAYELPKTTEIDPDTSDTLKTNTSSTDPDNQLENILNLINNSGKKAKGKYSDISTPEDSVEKVYKSSIILNDEKVLYFGSTSKIESLTRGLDIQAAIKDAIYKHARTKHYDLKSVIKPYDDDYVLYLDNKTVLRVTDIDALVNQVSKERLSQIWKYNIDRVIAENIKYIKSKTLSQLAQELGYMFLLAVVIIALIEFFRIQGTLHIKKIMQPAICKLQKTMHTIQTKTNKAAYEPPQEHIQNQIEHIAHQTSIIINLISRILQFMVFFIFIIVALYIIPETYTYINQFAHYLISYTVVALYSFQYWLTSRETWGSFLSFIFIVFQAVVIIYIVKIGYSINKNIIHILFGGNIVKIKRLETISLIIARTLEIIIVIIALFLILMELGINLAPILAGAGIAGLAISFGAQNLIKDIINGLFILTENQFGIGDWIKISEYSGVVEDMTLRTTLIRDLSGVAHIIPNGQISQVSVYTKNWSRANLDISIAYKEDINIAIELIKETADQMHQELSDIMIAEPCVLGVNSLGESSIDIKLIMDTVAGEQWGVEREFRRRIKYAFDKANIEIPFPHRTVYLYQEHNKSDKPENNETPDT
jgi:small-conductance mechanosensitive channel